MKLLFDFIVICVIIALFPSVVLAFHNRHRPKSPSLARRHHNELNQFRKPPRGSYPSMPPLISNSTIMMPDGRTDLPSINFLRRHTPRIFKVFRRNVYPTVDLPYESNYTMVDDYFMGMALQQARKAWERGEVPIGALIVRECTNNDDDNNNNNNNNIQSTKKRTFQILSAAHNRVETNIDASSHAELLALRNGAQNIGNWRYPPNSRLYTTVEPCPMCLASIQAFRIDNIIYGAPDNRLGAIKTHMNLLIVAKHPYHEIKSVTGGVREKECGDIMVQFFRQRRGGKKKLLKLPIRRESIPIKKQSRFVRFLKNILRRE